MEYHCLWRWEPDRRSNFFFWNDGSEIVKVYKIILNNEFKRDRRYIAQVADLGIEFYLFVSYLGMNDRGSTCKFRNARSAFRNLHVDPLSFIPPWEANK